jgi:integrase
MPTTNRVRLTEAMIERECRKPPPVYKTLFLRDSVVPGLAVRIHPTGQATYTLHKKKLAPVQLGWGKHLPYSQLDRIREQAIKELGAAYDPKQPTSRPPNQPFDTSTKIEPAFRRFAREYLEKRTSAVYVSESESRFRRFVQPAWKGRDVRSITRKDVRELVQGVEKQGKPYPANRTLSLLSSLFNWCIDNDLFDENQPNPARGVKKPGVERVRDRELSAIELALVWHGACALPGPWGAWAKLMLLTGQRRTEVASMRWEDVDLDAGTWTLSASQTKNKRSHVVTLSEEALNVLAPLPRDCPWPFTTSRAGPIKGYSHAKRLIDAWLAERVETVAPWDWHDLRRTCNSGLARDRVPPHVREAVLNHASQKVNERHYNRYDYLDEKREALDRWAQHVVEVAERYKPAPTEEELRQAKLRAAIHVGYVKRLAEIIAQGDEAAAARITGGGSLADAEAALLRERQPNP